MGVIERPARQPAAQLGEFGRIAAYFAPLASAEGLGLKDDAALIARPEGDLVVTVDAMVEGVHFMSADPADLIARKLLRVSLSDLAAMGAIPRSYLLSMALPARCDDAWVEGFAAGLAADQAEYAIGLIGGDSVATDGPISLSLTAFGATMPPGPVRRGTARPGDEIWVSGTIGDGALGLLVARGDRQDQTGFLLDRYRLPRPRVALGMRLAGVASAMMDVSDGLLGDLEHLVDASGYSAAIAAAEVPLSAAAATLVAADLSLMETVLTGGDDYELLFTAAPDAAEAVSRVAEQAAVPVTRIGWIGAGDGIAVHDRDGVPLEFDRMGYRHG